jgi:uncharacterized membrane protein YbhN (UPF0104 family)
VGIYYNALPSGLLGEGYRAHQVRACLPNQEISYFIVAFERLLGLMALLALAGLAHGLAPMPWHPLFTWVYSILGGAGLMALAAAFGLAPLMKKNLGQIVRVKFPWLGLLAGGVCTPRKMGIPFLLSCVSQTCFVSSIYCLLAPRLGAGMALNAFSVIPFIVLFNFVQVTPGGFGQREAVFVFCLGRIGFPSNVALSVSIMFYLVQTSIALLGGLCHFLERRRV